MEEILVGQILRTVMSVVLEALQGDRRPAALEAITIVNEADGDATAMANAVHGDTEWAQAFRRACESDGTEIIVRQWTESDLYYV